MINSAELFRDARRGEPMTGLRPGLKQGLRPSNATTTRVPSGHQRSSRGSVRTRTEQEGDDSEEEGDTSAEENEELEEDGSIDGEGSDESKHDRDDDLGNMARDSGACAGGVTEHCFEVATIHCHVCDAIMCDECWDATHLVDGHLRGAKGEARKIIHTSSPAPKPNNSARPKSLLPQTQKVAKVAKKDARPPKNSEYISQWRNIII